MRLLVPIAVLLLLGCGRNNPGNCADCPAEVQSCTGDQCDGGGVPDAGCGSDLQCTATQTCDRATGACVLLNHRVRIMAANTTSGNLQSYDPGEGIRIFQGLKPDIALIQEFNYGANTDAALRTFVDTAFDPSFSYYRQPAVQIPNGIVSRYPILAAGIWADPQVSNRAFSWARIDVPGPKDLWAVSLHLLTSNAGDRSLEATSLVAFINQNVPPGDFLVLGGDLNTGTRTEACITALAQVVHTAAPHPADQRGNGFTNSTRTKPYDWVLADADLLPFQVPVAIGASNFPDGLVVDSRVYTPLPEISPVQAIDSAAANMQHMAVVKDFLLH